MDANEIEIRFVVTEAIKAQLSKPTRAVVNSEGAFVAQRLRNDGFVEAASRYWSWNCNSRKNSDEFGEEIYNLQLQLEAIDAGVSMPSWGTYGT